ncbi:TonB-dependent receptor [Terriglobus aquaticus]|uniref:Carboxypeptidase regulatory-like domain-containing protein n=1 Tax=Terriglobus aquaticus TaxID=940139 RepID=A0ABW9KMD5_9BACT|nr:carboxypeptidase regulatory-like domain-containing protein [Terriglobus aquaticus]
MLAGAQANLGLNSTVQDQSGALVPNARLMLLKDGKTVQQVRSDTAGRVRFSNLRAGRYTLSAQAEGFDSTQQQVSLPYPGESLRIVLKVSSVVTDVIVSAGDQQLQVTTDPESNQNAVELDRDALDRLPVFDADYITTLTRFLNTDATGTNGVSLVVNGMESNGPGVSASGIQSVRINQNPYTAAYAAPGRARLEITTKGGTDQFHGSANFLYRNSLFDAREPFSASKPPQERIYFEGALTGPLGPGKKSTFLLTGNHDSNHQQAIVVAATPTGQVQTNVTNPTTHDFYSARAFHTFRGSDQLWIGYSYERRVVQNAGVGGTVLPEAGIDTHTFEHEINVGYSAVLSPRMLNQLRFLVGKADNRTDSITALPQTVVSGAFTGGGAQASLHRTENHFDGADVLTLTQGKHELKFGIDVPDISRRAYDDYTNAQGTYTFASLADYVAGRPSLFVVQQGQPRATFWEKVVAGYMEDTFRVRPNLSISAGLRYYFQNYFHDDPNNLAPRASFAYAPSTRGHIILRGGAGMFYDRSGPQPISDLLHYNGVTLRRYIVTPAAYPFPVTELQGLPTSVVRLDPATRIPSTLQYSFGVEDQLTRQSTLSATYVGTRGMHLFRSVDGNAPVGLNSIVRPNPTLGQERLLQSEGYLKADSLEVSFRGRPTPYFSGQAQYTLSKTYTNTQGILYFPADSYNPNGDWARSDNDRRHKFDLLGTVTMKTWLSVGSALSVYSGRPVNVTTGSDDNHDGVVVDRPLGLARNTLHGPGYLNLDLNGTHDFRLGRDKKSPVLSVSLNSFNVLNHLNPLTYVGVITSPFFARPVTAQPGRRMQLNLQFKF